VEYKLVSSDSHINEPPDLWTRDAPAAIADLVPRVIPVAQGDAWVMSPEMAPRPVSTSAAAGVKPEDYMKAPVTYKEMRPGSYDPVARLADMDMDHVDAEVLYPGIARALDQFATADVRLWCAQRYNDWLADFQKHSPDRLIALAILPPLDDGENAAKELERAIGLGLRGAFLAVTTGGRPLSHPDGEPLWELAEAERIPLSLHIGSSRALAHNLVDPSDAILPGVREAYISTAPIGIADHIAVLTYSGIFARHPRLRVVLAETGIGWLPGFIERMESVYDRHRHYLKSAIELRPTEVFHRHFFATFQEDAAGLRLRDILGVNNLMWASDYPHTDTTWPNSLETVTRYFADVPDDERRRILTENCVELYRLGDGSSPAKSAAASAVAPNS
jgi:predicted TIM-barrel fold metal-dependent hydrolase